MAYFTGTANNPADLVGKIAAHLGTVSGWVTDRLNASDWCFHNADGYWSAAWDTTGLYVVGNTGFDNAQGYNAQPGRSSLNTPAVTYDRTPTVTNLTAGPYTKYHLFATAQYWHLVLEVSAGVFRHCMVGTLDKMGIPYTGGQYLTAMFSYSGQWLNHSYASFPFDGGHGTQSGVGLSGRIRCDNVDGRPSPDWPVFASNSEAGEPRAMGIGRGGIGWQYHPDSIRVAYSANNLTESPLVIPCTIYVQAAQSRMRLIGQVRDFGVLNIRDVAAGDVITVGTDEWMVFPIMARGPTGVSDTGHAGYAYKRIP